MRGLFILILVIVVCFFGYKHFADQDTSSTSSSSSSSAAPAPGANATVDMTATEARVKAAAQKVGVEVTKFEPKGPREAVATVEWTGDVATLGGEFASEVTLEQKIARDFDEVKGAQSTSVDPQGHRHWRAAFDLKF